MTATEPEPEPTMPWYRVDGIVTHLKFGKGKAPAACCAPLRLGGRLERCLAMAGNLCDADVGEGLTCNAPLCDAHAHPVGPDRHLCPRHFARQFDGAPLAGNPSTAV